MAKAGQAGETRAMPAGAPAGWILGLPLLVFLMLPVLALIASSSPGQLAGALAHPMIGSAIWLSAYTTLFSMAIIALAGTPLSWWLARSRRRSTHVVETLLELPIVMPPAVVGVALLQAYGRNGLVGGWLADIGWSIPFTTPAVIVAQVAVAAPFYVQSATAGFRDLSDDLLLVARTLGASPGRAFMRVAVPAALPALMNGMALAWARALGEFGATLLFAGNQPDRTQTMPLAIYSALEVDIGLARALALILGAAAFVALLSLRLVPRLVRTLRERRPAA